MPSKKHRPEEIIGKLRVAEVVLAQVTTTTEADREQGIDLLPLAQEYDGLKTDQARRMKDL